MYDVGGAGIVAGAEHSQIVVNQVERTAEGIVRSSEIETTHGPANSGVNAVVLGNVIRDTRPYCLQLSGTRSSVVSCNQVFYEGAGSDQTRLPSVERGQTNARNANYDACRGNVLRYDGTDTAPEYAIDLFGFNR